MSTFFDKIQKSVDDLVKKSNGATNSRNSSGRFFGRKKDDRGGGKSLGGIKPGKLIRVSLSNPGPIGVKVEKTSKGNAIVAGVLPNSQAQSFGLKRGDIVCHANSDGEEEIQYRQFIAMASSNKRPIKFDVRRVEQQSVEKSTDDAKNTSADAYAKRQAVIAAAVARDKIHKNGTRHVKGDGKLSEAKMRKINEQKADLERRNVTYMSSKPMSKEARYAVEAAKKGEINHAQELGYNPYEASKMNSGQAKTATVSATHGSMNEDSGNVVRPSNTPIVSTPSSDIDDSSENEIFDVPFHNAFTILVTTNTENEMLSKCLSTIRKLIINATTKGQMGDDEASAKFRKIRLTNPKIAETITDVYGAVDLMISVGFFVWKMPDSEDPHLLYPPGNKGPTWLPKALNMMEKYQQNI